MKIQGYVNSVKQENICSVCAENISEEVLTDEWFPMFSNYETDYVVHCDYCNSVIETVLTSEGKNLLFERQFCSLELKSEDIERFSLGDYGAGYYYAPKSLEYTGLEYYTGPYNSVEDMIYHAIEKYLNERV